MADEVFKCVVVALGITYLLQVVNDFLAVRIDPLCVRKANCTEGRLGDVLEQGERFILVLRELNILSYKMGRYQLTYEARFLVTSRCLLLISLLNDRVGVLEKLFFLKFKDLVAHFFQLQEQVVFLRLGDSFPVVKQSV